MKWLGELCDYCGFAADVKVTHSIDLCDKDGNVIATHKPSEPTSYYCDDCNPFKERKK